VQRLRTAADAHGVQVVVPRPGQRVDVLDPPPLQDWWTAVGSHADADRPAETRTPERAP
jgi:hypothetical protein